MVVVGYSTGELVLMQNVKNVVNETKNYVLFIL